MVSWRKFLKHRKNERVKNKKH